MKDCAICGGGYDEYLGFTMHENRCAAIAPYAGDSVPGDGWSVALRNALDANVPVGTVNAATRDTIISNVIAAFGRALAHPTADRVTAEKALEWGREG